MQQKQQHDIAMSYARRDDAGTWRREKNMHMRPDNQ